MGAIFTIGKSIERGLPLHVRDAKNGSRCNCICYECAQKLEIVQGQRNGTFVTIISKLPWQ